MIEKLLLDELKLTLGAYRAAIPKVAVAEARSSYDDHSVFVDKLLEAKSDYLNHAAIIDKALKAIEVEDLSESKVMIYAFHRAVSDSWYKQPPEYRPLADAVRKIEKIVMKME